MEEKQNMRPYVVFLLAGSDARRKIHARLKHKMNLFKIADDQLEEFLSENVKKYEKNRNYDWGPENRTNVSNLSHFISHRAVLEYDAVLQTLNRQSYKLAEKFIQEIFWRVYWKGWLEMRPTVWGDFKRFEIEDNEQDLLNAYNGNTGIDCFDDWVRELKETNYLHNHTRMWFASIWIFTLKLSWQSGAAFFLKHLKDGDAASNTLGWRWVAGIQTKGKHYLAKSWNIEKFTNGRHTSARLNENAEPVQERIDHPIIHPAYTPLNTKRNDSLIIFENDLNFAGRENLYGEYKNVYLVCLDNEQRKFKIAEPVLNFKNSLLCSFQEAFPHPSQITNDFHVITANEKGFDVVYPFVGESLDYINALKEELSLDVSFLHRKQDLFCINFCNKGFFNFKQNIPRIIEEIKPMTLAN